jgi:hypothetical protein
MSWIFCAMLIMGQAVGTTPSDPVFSGPQKGEKLADFKILGVYDDQAGVKSNYWDQAGDKATLLIFVHELTRPSVAVMRTLSDFAGKHADKMYTSVVFLGEDATALEEQLNRARHAMPRGIPVNMSADGAEGPGAYGLNRNVTLTILVSKDRKVTANFALVQPSVQADVPKVLKEVVAIVGGEVPSIQELGGGRAMQRPMARGGAEGELDLRSLLRPVIQKNATVEQVDAAAKKAEDYFAKHPRAALEAGTIARRIIDADKLENYGTERAQEYLRKWAKAYKAEPRPKRESKRDADKQNDGS